MYSPGLCPYIQQILQFLWRVSRFLQCYSVCPAPWSMLRISPGLWIQWPQEVVVIVVGLEERDHSFSSHLLQMMLSQTFQSKKGQCPQEGKLLPLVRKTLVNLGFEDCQFHFTTTRCPQSTFQVFILSKSVPSVLHQKLDETVSSTDVENSTNQLLNFCDFFLAISADWLQ